jgi:hypothetical protein
LLDTTKKIDKVIERKKGCLVYNNLGLGRKKLFGSSYGYTGWICRIVGVYKLAKIPKKEGNWF